MNKLIFVILLVANAAITLGAGVGMPVNGEEKSPFDSGFAHGREDCQDIKSGVDQEDVYIFKDEYGPDMHTSEFMDGFYDGWYDAGCAVQELNDMLYPEVYSDNSGIENSFNNRDSVVQPQSQSANTVQSNSCPQMIVNGDCITGQEQKTHNEFAQANRADN